jgi:hypothetical protein
MGDAFLNTGQGSVAMTEKLSKKPSWTAPNITRCIPNTKRRYPTS